MLQAEIGDQDDGRFTTLVAGEVDVAGALGEALPCRVAPWGAGPVGAVVERERARRDRDD